MDNFKARSSQKLFQEKTMAYGKIFILFRRGMITTDEMLAKADKLEKEYLIALDRIGKRNQNRLLMRETPYPFAY